MDYDERMDCTGKVFKKSFTIKPSVKKRGASFTIFKNALTIYENDQSLLLRSIFAKKNPICFPTSRWDTSHLS